MHVKQLTTSQALCIKESFTSFSLERVTGGGESATTHGSFEVTGQLFAYSTNLLQHVTVYEQYSSHPARGAGDNWTHTYTH